MMSKNDERRIIDSLANDKTVEMKSDDLVQMLNDELSKPESEIDAQLIKEILDALEPSAPDPAQVRDGWLHVKESIAKRRVRKRWPVRAAQFAVASVVVCMILVSAMEDAGAFRWTLLQKILKPVAETFGIVMGDQPVDPLETVESAVYSVSDAPSDWVAYSTMDEVPEMHEGYVIRPRWLPEGSVLSVGSRFTSQDTEVFTLDFMRDQETFSLFVHISTLDSKAYFQEFERNLDVPMEMTIGQHQVTFYNNTEDREQSAFWIHENAHYLLVGELSFDEVSKIIEQM